MWGYKVAGADAAAYVWGSKDAPKEGVDAVYSSYPLAQINDLKVLLSAVPLLRGLNVTIPYKQAIIPYLTELDSVAGGMGAVNCIDIRNGILRG